MESWFTDISMVKSVSGEEIHFRWVNWEPKYITVEDDGPVLEAIPSKRFVFWVASGYTRLCHHSRDQFQVNR
jgi:hypothetical protein